MISRKSRLAAFGIFIFIFLSIQPLSARCISVSFAELAKKVQHSVVNISTTQVIEGGPFIGPLAPFRDFFGDDFFKRFFGDLPQGELKTHALGSGFIIDSSGLILTNNHVIEKATEIKVKLQNGDEYDAEVLGRDPKTDLALLKVKPGPNFPAPAKLGDSDKVQVGDWVIAIGNPFGLGHTVTAGIISAKGRIIGAGPYDDFLQTDAAINPGNSGGPLFNMEGEVVGINTAIIAHGQGIGFAIPINMAKQLLPQLKTGTIVRGWLGVVIQDLTPELAKSFGLERTRGVLIADVVPEGPADRAGLKRGDVIIGFAGKPARNAHVLSRLVAATPPGSRVKIEYIRNGYKRTITVAIGRMPQGEAPIPGRRSALRGLTVQRITPELARHLGLGPGIEGVVVSHIDPGSPAAKSGLRVGDVIIEVNRKPVKSLGDFYREMDKVKSSDSVLLLVLRGEHTFYVVLEPVG